MLAFLSLEQIGNVLGEIIIWWAQLVQGVFVEHGCSLVVWIGVDGAVVPWLSVVVARSAHVLVQWQARLHGDGGLQRALVQTTAQDGCDALVGR